MVSQSTGSNLDRATGGGGDPLVALVRKIGQRVDAAAANVILAGNIRIRGRAAHFLDGLGKALVERALALGGGKVEVGGLNDAGGNYRRFGQGRSCTASQQRGDEKLCHVVSPFSGPVKSGAIIHLCPQISFQKQRCCVIVLHNCRMPSLGTRLRWPSC